MLEFRYPAEIDRNGVANGIELSRLLIHDAVSLMLPYVDGCPACLDAMFAKIANRVLEDHHHRLKENENASLFFSNKPEGSEQEMALAAHKEDNLEVVRALIESEDQHHH
jgi:hypothetical protein